MWSILNYLYRIRLHILFVLYSIVSLGMLVGNDPYHYSRWRSTMVEFQGNTLNQLNTWRSYWGLRAANEELNEQLAIARTRLYQDQLVDSAALVRLPQIRSFDSLFTGTISTNNPDSVQSQALATASPFLKTPLIPKASDSSSEYKFIAARVVGNSTIHRHNYMILNRGSRDGVKPRMGVAGPKGAIGIVDQVSEHFCTIITLIHAKARLSAGLAKKDAVGTLFWEGGMINRATLIDIPMHVPVKKGDTVYTSAYSLTFPPGIPVGRVRSHRIPDGESVYRIGVDLFTDFRSVQYVHLIDYKKREERLRLEDKIATDD